MAALGAGKERCARISGLPLPCWVGSAKSQLQAAVFSSGKWSHMAGWMLSSEPSLPAAAGAVVLRLLPETCAGLVGALRRPLCGRDWMGAIAGLPFRLGPAQASSPSGESPGQTPGRRRSKNGRESPPGRPGRARRRAVGGEGAGPCGTRGAPRAGGVPAARPRGAPGAARGARRAGVKR